MTLFNFNFPRRNAGGEVLCACGSPADRQPLIVSVHIPKCGGTSFQHVLLGVFGRRGTLLDHRPRSLQAKRFGPDAIAPRIQCIHGHFRSDACDGCGRPIELMTRVRHPVQRVVSNYYHFLRHPDPDNPCCRELLGRRLHAFRFIGVVEREGGLRVMLAHTAAARRPGRPGGHSRST